MDYTDEGPHNDLRVDEYQLHEKGKKTRLGADEKGRTKKKYGRVYN